MLRLDHSQPMKRIVPAIALLLAVAAAGAQAPPREPVPGPSTPPRSSLWQLLTPEQREQLWRTLTPEQKVDVWRGLEPNERRAMRERLAPGTADSAIGPWPPRHGGGQGEGKSRMMMTPEQRLQMREQIREAHRLRREKLEAERERRMGRE
jgi:hypothetical protein